MSKVATQAAGVAAPAATEGLLLRKCDCGKHTVAGGECQDCGKEKQQSFSSGSDSSIGGSFAIPRLPLQPKLTVGPADDPLEQEADSVADQVMGSGITGLAKPRIQRHATHAAGESEPAPPSVSNTLAGVGHHLDPSLRHDMEMRFGHDFSRVRVHSDAAAEQSAQDVGALAYTVGQQIVFGAGQFQPGSHSGRRLLAHELTHVVQQSNGVFPALAPFVPPNRVFRAVKPKPANRLKRIDLIGDGTAAKPGIDLGTFKGYISTQADWFVEPTLTDADRNALWKLVDMFDEGDHISMALGNLKIAELIKATKDELKFIRDYADGANAFVETVRITDPHDKMSRVIELGKAMRELATFVPTPVLRVVINQKGLEALVDENLIQVFKDYYKDFKPTIEAPAEQDALLTLFRGGLAPFTGLTDWVHDLHVFTPGTRTKLAANITNKKREKPVLLILMSGLDWNSAFFQKSALESTVLNAKNLALVIQGPTKLSEAITKVNKVADDYGQIPAKGAKPRIKQVVFAGHGQAASVEMATAGTTATNKDDKYVKYDQENLEPKKPADDSELLIDAVLQRMNPRDARVVFAGCLVGSHDIPETPDLKDPTKAAAEINASLKANPNLRDLVNQRLAALKIKGTVEAANASTTFSAFNIDPRTGKARLFLSWDPDVGGTKKDYVRTGAEPEGALRAALETWADPKLGPAWTTKTMRDFVTANAASKEWWKSLTRTAYELALPAAGDVNPAVLANLQHRVEPWLLAGWASSSNAERLGRAVKAAEADKVYGVMLVSDRKNDAHLPIVVQQAWMTVDATHEGAFLAAIEATTLKRAELMPLLKDNVIHPKLASLLKTADPKKPSRGQLRLAVLYAIHEGELMHAEVKKLLFGAAGGAKTSSFPAALNIGPLLEGVKELEVLENIGLAPGTAPSPGQASSDVEANVDLDNNKINQTFVAVAPRKIAIDDGAYVRSAPNRRPGSKVLT
ncbi:MAG TPA: DUF4157 domain-containing protein, partial [Pyrinomonadaceae bacterium]|nr:DUF4157 domain-containing protein [Pyrinomonadaceae bacterium]